MITHRCKKSLSEQVSIRYEYQYSDESLRYFSKDKLAWRLFKYEPFEDEFMHIAKINSCPFCGKLLENNSKKTIDNKLNK